MRIITVLFFLALPLLAEDAPRKSVSEKARGDFWKASLIAAQADAAKVAADAAKLAAIEAMKKDCGTWALDLDQKAQEPVCVEPVKQPEPAKP